MTAASYALFGFLDFHTHDVDVFAHLEIKLPTFAYIVSIFESRKVGKDFDLLGFARAPIAHLLHSFVLWTRIHGFSSVQGTLENTNKHVMAMAPLQTQTDSGALAKPNSANDHQINTSPK